jgi:DNA-binding NarL/FixJ family response regulator
LTFDASNPILFMKRASIAGARQAYFQGDFDRCLEICSQIQIKSLGTGSEVALLMARAYLRLRQYAEAQAAIVENIDIHTEVDAQLTAQMLLAQVWIHQGNLEEAVTLIDSVSSRAADTNFTVQSEISLTQGLAYWGRRDVRAAENALKLVDPRSDIIHARALEALAWCSAAGGDVKNAVNYLRQAIMKLGECRAQDKALYASAVSMLSAFLAEVLDPSLEKFVFEHSHKQDWTCDPGGRYLALMSQAHYLEFFGKTVESFQLANEATEIASNQVWKVMSWAERAIMAEHAGEAYTAAMYANQALKVLEQVDRSNYSFPGDERICLLTAAEACAVFQPEAAAALFAEFKALATIDRLITLTTETHRKLYTTYVQAVIAQAQGHDARATQLARSAFKGFAKIGYTRRAAEAAYRLMRLTNNKEAHAFIIQATIGVENYITRGLAALPNDPVAAVQHHPAVKSLPRALREVTVLICRGKTNQEIADLRGVPVQTIKNLVYRVIRELNVTSRAGLLSALLGNPNTRHSKIGSAKVGPRRSAQSKPTRKRK